MAERPLERLPLDPLSPWWGEHRSRYLIAQELARGRSVLDIACGSGFGAAMLVQAGASRVVACDVDPDGVASAARGTTNAAMFVAGDGTALPIASNAFDVVVSFETLEHIGNARSFLSELRRVLRPDGTLLLSTPNAEVTARYPKNPFHVREYTPRELGQLLSEVFPSVDIVGQVLPERYAMTPFLPGYDRPRNVGEGAHLVAWKLLRRLPRSAADFLARSLLRRPLYPAATDFRFARETRFAHVLLATCRI